MLIGEDVMKIRILHRLGTSIRRIATELSMSLTMSETTSEARRPAPQATPSAAWYFTPGAASRSRATSSGLRIPGSLWGARTVVIVFRPGTDVTPYWATSLPSLYFHSSDRYQFYASGTGLGAAECPI